MGFRKRERTGAGGLNGERAKRLDKPNEKRGGMKGQTTFTISTDQASCHIGTGKGRS
ncbi:uncharacterized, partial [Tachysurus ichikawai]